MNNTAGYQLEAMSNASDMFLDMFIIGGVVLIVASLIGNGLVVGSFIVNKRTHKKPNFFLLSLSISDCLSASVCMVIWNYFLAHRFMNIESELVLYKAFMTVDSLCGVSSIMNILAVSLVRCSSVIKPLHVRAQSNSGYIITAILFPWGMGLLVSLLWLTIYDVWEHYYILVASIFYFLPLILIIMTYIIMIVISKRRATARRQSRALRQNIAAAQTMGIVVGCFIITWAPFFILGPLTTYCTSCDLAFFNKYRIQVAAVVKFMQYSNSMMNPIIYAARLDEFRLSFKIVLYKVFCFFSPEKHMHIYARSRCRPSYRYSFSSSRNSRTFKSSSVMGELVNGDSLKDKPDSDNNHESSDLCTKPDPTLVSDGEIAQSPEIVFVSSA